MPRPIKHHELQHALRRHDPRFQILTNRGKGSHYMLYHPDVAGHSVSVPVPCHGGRDVPPRIVAQIIRRFALPPGVLP